MPQKYQGRDLKMVVANTPVERVEETPQNTPGGKSQNSRKLLQNIPGNPTRGGKCPKILRGGHQNGRKKHPIISGGNPKIGGKCLKMLSGGS